LRGVARAIRHGKRFPDRRVGSGGYCDADHELQAVRLQSCVSAAHVWDRPLGGLACARHVGAAAESSRSR
jgi:hypothetical protein